MGEERDQDSLSRPLSPPVFFAKVYHLNLPITLTSVPYWE